MSLNFDLYLNDINEAQGDWSFLDDIKFPQWYYNIELTKEKFIRALLQNSVSFNEYLGYFHYTTKVMHQVFPNINKPRNKTWSLFFKELAGIQDNNYYNRKSLHTPYYADKGKIKQIYNECPEGYEVDHIVPLSKGGLHHQDNLQYLTKSDNCKKRNKLNSGIIGIKPECMR